jgi:hypothetical protein
LRRLRKSLQLRNLYLVVVLLERRVVLLELLVVLLLILRVCVLVSRARRSFLLAKEIAPAKEFPESAQKLPEASRRV